MLGLPSHGEVVPDSPLAAGFSRQELPPQLNSVWQHAVEAAYRSPLVASLTTAKHPNADLPAEEDSASDTAESAERSPKLALPVPVGLAEPPEVGTEEATEDEDMMAEPNYTFAKGYGRFGTGYTRSATALGNFEQGSIEAESAVVAQWLTSGYVLPWPAQDGTCCLPA